MLRIAASARKASKPLVRTFTFSSGTHVPVTCAVTLEYVPRDILADEQEKSKQRVLGTGRRTHQLEDMQEINRALENIVYEVIAGRVQKITGMTLAKLHALLPLDESVLDEATASGSLHGELDLDPNDKTPLAEEDAAEGVSTKGALASANILSIVKGVPRFKEWVEAIITDVSYFTDGDIEERQKNSRGASA